MSDLSLHIGGIYRIVHTKSSVHYLLGGSNLETMVMLIMFQTVGTQVCFSWLDLNTASLFFRGKTMTTFVYEGVMPGEIVQNFRAWWVSLREQHLDIVLFSEGKPGTPVVVIRDPYECIPP